MHPPPLQSCRASTSPIYVCPLWCCLPTLMCCAGVNDSMDSVVARSATDSIFGIASDICCAAVGGALTSSYGGLGSAGPRSPHPSGMHTRTVSAFTQRTHGTPYSSVDTENLLASTDLSAPPSLPPSTGGAAADIAAAAASPQAVPPGNFEAGVPASGPEAVSAHTETSALPAKDEEANGLIGRLCAAQEMAEAAAAAQSIKHPSPGEQPLLFRCLRLSRLAEYACSRC